MNITVEELRNLNQDEYVLFDMREESERAQGAIPGSVPVSAEELLENPPLDKIKKYVVYCHSGVKSVEVAKALENKGYEAYSLEWGYVAWLYDVTSRQSGEELQKRAEHSLQTTFRKELWSRFMKAVRDYKLVEDGDKIAVCISGGKDSMLMAKLFQELKRYSPVKFEVEYLVMDPGYNQENLQIIKNNAANLGVPIRIFQSNIFESVYHVEKYPCYLCARMRRGHLYHFAKELGCNKIALGHHYDDVIETILMGMLYGAQIQTMMPKLHSTNFAGMELIRPLYLIREQDIKRWRDYNGLNFIRCACKFTDDCASCNNEETRSKRVEIKELIAELKKKNPDVENHIFKSVENVNLSTVIAYKDKKGTHHFLDTYDDEE